MVGHLSQYPLDAQKGSPSRQRPAGRVYAQQAGHEDRAGLVLALSLATCQTDVVTDTLLTTLH